MELHFFGLWIFKFRSLKFGKNRSFCGISGIFLEISGSEKYFPDSGKWPFHTPPIHTPTKCRPKLGKRKNRYKQKPHKGIWWPACLGSVPTTTWGRIPGTSRMSRCNLCVNPSTQTGQNVHGTNGPAEGQCEFFGPDFWVEFWKVIFGRWISWGWIFLGAAFAGKPESKNSTWEFGSKIRASKICFPEFGPKFGFRRRKNPLCRLSGEFPQSRPCTTGIWACTTGWRLALYPCSPTPALGLRVVAHLVKTGHFPWQPIPP